MSVVAELNSRVDVVLGKNVHMFEQVERHCFCSLHSVNKAVYSYINTCCMLCTWYVLYMRGQKFQLREKIQTETHSALTYSKLTEIVFSKHCSNPCWLRSQCSNKHLVIEAILADYLSHHIVTSLHMVTAYLCAEIC